MFRAIRGFSLHDEQAYAVNKWLRRLRTYSLLVLMTVLVTSTFPLLLLCALAVDLVRALRRGTPWMSTRLLLFLLLYLSAQCVGVTFLGLAWVFAGVGQKRQPQLIRWTYVIQTRWVCMLLKAIERLFSLTFSLTGFDQVTPGPLLVFVRHCSIIDTLLPTAFLAATHQLRLKFVLKRELLNDPCIDTAGSRLPNYFAARDGADSTAEIAAVSSLASNLSATEGLLLFPEGTRFSPHKRARLLERLKDKDPQAYQRAESLKHVLPPRLGGALASLQASDADVLFFAHQGLDGFASARELFRGALVRRTIHVRVWRVKREEIPQEPALREQWLHKQWQQLDDTIGELKALPDHSH